MIRQLVLAALAWSAAALPLPARAQTLSPAPEASQMVATLVEVPRPWYAPRGTIVKAMVKSVPRYQAAAGLAEKHFILSETKTIGGLYLWRDGASADAFYDAAWHQRVRRQYGRDATIARFAVPLTTDGPAAVQGALTENADSVAVVVRIPIPAGVPRERIAAGMQQALPQYQAAPGLVRKWFTIGDDNQFGGIYLWQSRAAADAWFNTAWHTRVRTTYGLDGEVRFFSAPLTLRN